MGKTRFIAETGAGQHGVATATVGAKFGIPVEVFMGAVDVERQALNVYVMQLLGATVHSVESGTRTLKDATNEAFRDWAGRVDDTFYIIGSVVGAHPYPYMVREFQKVIGDRSARAGAGALRPAARPTSSPASAAAATRWGSSPASSTTRRSGCGASKRPATGCDRRSTAASLNAGTVGILHGSRSYVLQTAEGQVRDTHSISAGLDYPGRRSRARVPKDSGRATYVAVDRRGGAGRLSRDRAQRRHRAGARERRTRSPSRCKLARERGPDGLILVNLSGRGDKDVRTVAALDAAAPAPVPAMIAADDRLASGVRARARRKAAPR